MSRATSEALPPPRDEAKPQMSHLPLTPNGQANTSTKSENWRKKNNEIDILKKNNESVRISLSVKETLVEAKEQEEEINKKYSRFNF